MMKIRPALRAAAIVAAFALTLTGCGSQTTSGSAGAQGGQKKVFYIPKRMDQAWYQVQADGVKTEGAKDGLDVKVLDSRFDGSQQQANLDTAFSQGAQGLVLVIQDQTQGPAVLSQAKAHNVPVIEIDDNISDSDGKPAPFVGMATEQIGQSVGEMLADEAKQRNMATSQIGVAALTFNQVSVCSQRTNATHDALLKAMPGLQASQIHEANYAGANTDGGLQAMQGLLTANPQVKSWLVYSCNEEGIVGAVRALEGAGKDKTSCGVGIGDGSLAKIEFDKGTAAYCGDVFANSKKHGQIAAQEMADYLNNGKAIPQETLVPGVKVTKDNYKQVFGS
ncbi:hypothetical protein SA2016_0964 [Sinomonas atrocyanea]|uniref:Periplasmic binding protein domain-containing protein n=1 Tax=Sinomonas atrocyanea TaxID=37927 RepID=A0A126ZWT4_9MICC|nr:arabinose ABC transporter substrate-binding protein [Sinomonas atrocyanea]AMM31649.1 hypothetical protein SA2016_0964 [Sinomonas atrocyanea]GEB64199.1 sugar ABC transporter substrate-binding protein [Sinomonas atrocyanea]GGG57157.1 sugar ABC transporter substrate-binding protein [Sinomonas atrocyanea]